MCSVEGLRIRAQRFPLGFDARVEKVEARSYQTFKLVYTLGRYGLDDTGAIRVAFRAMSDFGRLQVHDPTAPGYTTAKASNGCKLTLDYQARGHNRPRFKSLTVHVGGVFKDDPNMRREFLGLIGK